MEDDFYGADRSEPVEADPVAEKREPDSDEGETALVNDSFFPSECKVGDTYKVKVVAQHDGEKEISFVSEEEEEVEVDGESMDSMIDKQAALA